MRPWRAIPKLEGILRLREASDRDCPCRGVGLRVRAWQIRPSTPTPVATSRQWEQVAANPANIPRMPPFMTVRRRVDNAPTCHDHPRQFAIVRSAALPKSATLGERRDVYRIHS
jgi:hypothetical protein